MLGSLIREITKFVCSNKSVRAYYSTSTPVPQRDFQDSQPMAAFTSPSASTTLEDSSLSVWYNCLRQCDVHKTFVLPRGSENDSDDAELLALLGDSVLKVQILKVMGVLDSGAQRSSIKKIDCAHYSNDCPCAQ